MEMRISPLASVSKIPAWVRVLSPIKDKIFNDRRSPRPVLIKARENMNAITINQSRLLEKPESASPVLITPVKMLMVKPTRATKPILTGMRIKPAMVPISMANRCQASGFTPGWFLKIRSPDQTSISPTDTRLIS